MTEYFFNYEERSRERFRVECDTVEEARNETIRHLGAYLTEHPEFATQGHWRVNLEDAFGTVLLHVIVATVTKGEGANPG